MKGEMSSIDEGLLSGSQQTVARLVHALPEEMPSMVWRSSLNEAVLKEAGRIKRRRRIVWFGSPVLGFGLACALAAVVMIRPMSTRTAGEDMVAVTFTGSSVEASLFDVHRDDVRALDLDGPGLAAAEGASVPSAKSPETNDESEADLDL